MEIELRTERPEDYRETENVTREAFWNHFVPGCCEHYLLHIMRDCPAFLPELDIVAVYDGSIVGNVICTKSVVKGDDGKEYEVLGLGPISVLPAYQGKGIGGKLIARVQELARERGDRGIFLYGDPDYYGRHGFTAAERFGIRTSDDYFADALQGCELYEGALSDMRGRYVEDAVFGIDPAAVDLFDRQFPPKEKVSGTPSQKRFTEIAARRKNAK
ncbi:GNAT family N-acetyltransferase [Zongyangia hominis]|uniref:N-acetyltransferase n=1 Tax=Zongyangia hominis TaxID=2763677 RepID=A0A926E7S0_9FIRM|nr:N-acetyltransferase [Zongyangia hominis]MBC8569420.1 N-acetyltransferase [Zongyangia hominis]